MRARRREDRTGGRAHRLTPLLVAAVAFTVLAPLPSAGAAGCGAGDVADPEPFQWTAVGSGSELHYVGTLEYGQASFELGGETFTTRAYRQEGGSYSLPGPTIHMEPGQRYVLRFRNLLPYEPATHEHNTFTDPNVTNVHTHGLHISGEAPGDDVTRMFEGGTGGDYVYDIPADHMGGTFWYHAHHHGSTFLQVSTGGFGLIVIDDAADGLPDEVAAMTEQQVLLGYLDPGAAGTGGDTIVGGTLAPGWTVNGEVGATLCLPPGTWQHWRVLLADRDAKPKDVSIGAGCEVKLLARDGVWRTTAPKDLPTGTINLTGASRADLAVRCSGPADLRVGTSVVASIRVAGSADIGPSPYDDGGTWSAIRPSYLRDLRAVTDVHRERINMGARTVNGTKFDVDVPNLTLSADAVQEWDLRGASNHPFHLHVYHVQAQAGCGGDFEEGEYYDVMAASCAVRFDLNAATSSPYEGRTIMHCHILEHEDQGAMGWLDVIGGTPPPEFPAGQGYELAYTLGVTAPSAPTDLTATATSTSTIALTWTDTSADETGFELERSTDGGTIFSSIATVAADSTGYDDTGLTADTTYHYRLRAIRDGSVSAWSGTASATTDADGGGASELEVSVTAAVVDLGRGFKAGEATVVVRDVSGQPVAGVDVTGAFSETFTEGPFVGSTDASGTVRFATDGSSRGSVSVTFCVTAVDHPDFSGGAVCASS